MCSSDLTVKCMELLPSGQTPPLSRSTAPAASNRFHFYYNTADFLVPLPISPLKKDHIRTAVRMWSLFFPDGQRAGLSGFSPICSFCAAPGDAYFLRLTGNFLIFFQHSASTYLLPAVFPRRTGRPQRFERRGAIPGRSVRQNEQFNRAAQIGRASCRERV